MNGKEFAEIYTERDGCRQAFVNVTKLLNSPLYRRNERMIFNPSSKSKVIDRDGFLFAVVRIRFVNAISKAGDNLERIRMLLEQLFRPEAIEYLFPDFWIADRNVVAKRQQAADKQRRNYERKRHLGQYDQTHREVSHITRNKSVKAHVTEQRQLQLS